MSEISEIAIASTELPSLFCIDHTASRPLTAAEFLFWSKIDPVLSQVVNHNPFKSPVPLPCPHIPGALVDFLKFRNLDLDFWYLQTIRIEEKGWTIIAMLGTRSKLVRKSNI